MLEAAPEAGEARVLVATSRRRQADPPLHAVEENRLSRPSKRSTTWIALCGARVGIIDRAREFSTDDRPGPPDRRCRQCLDCALDKGY